MLEAEGAGHFMIPSQMNIGAGSSPFFYPLGGWATPIKAGRRLLLGQGWLAADRRQSRFNFDNVGRTRG
jgi:hypothetical protein